jgi:hypothetical protein
MAAAHTTAVSTVADLAAVLTAADLVAVVIVAEVISEYGSHVTGSVTASVLDIDT